VSAEIRTIPPLLTRFEWNALLDHSLEKGASFIIRSAGTAIQGIDGSTGKLAASGTDLVTVMNAIISGASGGAGCDIFLKPFPAIITGQIELPYDYINIRGAGRGTLLKLANALNLNMAVFHVTANHCLIENLQLDGNKANQTANEQHGIFIEGTSGAHILRNTVKDCYIHDFGRATGLGSAIKNDYHDFGIMAHNYCKANNHWGIATWNDCKYIEIANNIIEDSYEGIEIHGYTWNPVVIGNIVYYCSKHGIINDGANNCFIVGNNVYSNGRGASYDGKGGTGIRNNGKCHIIGNYVSQSGESGIGITNVNEAYVLDNFVEGSSQNTTKTWANIEILYNALNCYIANNVCRLGPAGNIPKYGIRVKSDAGAGNRIVNNDLLNSGDTAAFLAEVACFVKGNPGYNPTGYISPDPTWGSSPWTYTAGNTPEDLFISGGTITSITKGAQVLGITAGLIHLEPGESIVITYSAAGTIKRFGV
jgi:hypothetical protein